MFAKINITDLQKKAKEHYDIRLIGLIAFGFVVLLVAWSSVKALQLNYDLQKQENALKQKTEIQRLQNENLNLQNVYLESDEYLELSARRELNKAAPGEKLYLVPKSVAMSHTVDLPKTEQQIKEEKAQNKTGYQKNLEAWKKFFFHSGEE